VTESSRRLVSSSSAEQGGQQLVLAPFRRLSVSTEHRTAGPRRRRVSSGVTRLLPSTTRRVYRLPVSASSTLPDETCRVLWPRPRTSSVLRRRRGGPLGRPHRGARGEARRSLRGPLCTPVSLGLCQTTTAPVSPTTTSHRSARDV